MEWFNAQYFWILIAIPLVALLFFYASSRRKSAYAKLGNPELVGRLMSTISPRRRRWKAGLATLGVLFISLALIGPRFGSQLREVKREGIDLMIALDVSLSMKAEDVAPNRLDRSRNEIKKLLDGLRGDRVGLVVFSGDAFVQCPLTTDYGAVRLFLDVASPDLIPTPGTDFSAALRTTISAFESAKEDGIEGTRTQALLFVSDGENHIPNLDELIGTARQEGIVMFSAGVGETEGVPIPISKSRAGVGYKKDRQGRVVTTRLEEETLKQLAQDGAYFRIAKTASSLPKIITALDRLEKNEFGIEEFESYDEKYQWPLALGLLFLGLDLALTDRIRRSKNESIAADL